MAEPGRQTEREEYLPEEEGDRPEKPAAEARTAPAPSALDEILEATSARGGGERSERLERFLGEPSSLEALKLWFGSTDLGGLNKRSIVKQLGRDIAQIDAMLSEQLDAILHHPRFQRLEASWRGLSFLVEDADVEEGVKIKILNVSWKELARDAERAVEFDQSKLFQKIYSEEFDMPGGEPFGVLIGDYQIRHRPSADHRVDDLDVLNSISQVAAAAFSPFVGGADPALFGLERFSQLERPQNVRAIFDQEEYVRWRSFRDTEDSRFVGLTLPRVLMRLPYEDDGTREDGFRYRENVEASDNSKYLWGNAAYAFGSVLIRAFTDSGWLAEIRGVNRDEESGGLVTGLPVHSFNTDSAGVMPKSSADLIVTDRMEKELGDLGFIPLCHCKDTEYSVFYGNQSLQKPKVYNELAATMNAKISAMLQYMLCVSRFAHYLKAFTQQKIGSYQEASELEYQLNTWINDYVAPDMNAAPEIKARFPLREAQVEMRERPDKPGNYSCIMRLLPHYQLDTLSASVTLRTEIRQTQPR